MRFYEAQIWQVVTAVSGQPMSPADQTVPKRPQRLIYIAVEALNYTWFTSVVKQRKEIPSDYLRCNKSSMTYLKLLYQVLR